MEIQIGLPCNNEIICSFLGWGLLLLAAAIVVAIGKGIWDEYRKR